MWRGVNSVILGAGMFCIFSKYVPFNLILTSIRSIGPAHAVYFATYEGAKELLGATSSTEHYILETGMFYHPLTIFQPT